MRLIHAGVYLRSRKEKEYGAIIDLSVSQESTRKSNAVSDACFQPQGCDSPQRVLLVTFAANDSRHVRGHLRLSVPTEHDRLALLLLQDRRSRRDENLV